MFDTYTRHTLFQVTKGAAIGLVAFSLLLLLGWWLRMLQEGLSGSELVESALWFLAMSGVMVVPAAVVVSVAQQVGRALNSGELVALEAGGVSWKRAYRGVVLFGVLLGVLMMVAEETVIVYASARKDAMMRSLAAQILRTTSGRNRILEIPQAVIFCREYRSGIAKGVVLFGWPKGKEVEATARQAKIEVAEDGSMVFLELRNARIWLRDKMGADYIECHRYVVCRPLRLPQKERPQTVNIKRALELAEEMRRKAERGNRHAAIYHSRYITEAAIRLSLPWGAIIATLFGIGIGHLFPKSGGVIALFAVALLFYTPLLTFVYLGKTGMSQVWLLMVAVVAFDLSVGVVMFCFARRPR